MRGPAAVRVDDFPGLTGCGLVNDNPLSPRVPEDGLAGRADLDVIATARHLRSMPCFAYACVAARIMTIPNTTPTHLWRDYAWREIARIRALARRLCRRRPAR
jgi:hypothetical protein